MISIIKLSAEQQPSFLADLNRNPLKDVSLQCTYDDGTQTQITLDRHFHGFTQLYSTRDDRPVAADIVAITGMDGHAYGSWMSREGNGVMWLRDFLSRDMPHCRTMIYGYHSKLLALNLSQLKEYGRLFMEEIEKIRSTKEMEDGRWRRTGSPVLKVAEASATLQLPTFRERKIPVNANHSDMVKFSSPADVTYTSALKILREFVRDAPRVVESRYNPPNTATKAAINIPFYRSANFLGREDILDRLEDIFNSAQHHRRAALIGMGGMGKSTIAINYAARLRKQNPSTSMFWVDASTATSFDQSYIEIADLLRIEGRDEPEVNINRLVYDYLSNENNGKWLMILDNADGKVVSTTDTVKNGHIRQSPTPSSFIPRGQHGSILTTSRDRGVASELIGLGSSIITVSSLDELNSLQLLRERSGDKDSPDDDALFLIRSLDKMPLVITQAAAFISSSASSITRYNAAYRKRLQDL
ncbi:hypothetical protein NW762_008907 [Fusarium torreyae]|uniref:NB-ARC domain-containing protein n=1 Tax=Fusarium torreyae TaxID=1237075 RepID=A0A9W8RXZ2_9HYPO|nr:hypothetical protein NW762_008907 [Fusarium torreyae]